MFVSEISGTLCQVVLLLELQVRQLQQFGFGNTGAILSVKGIVILSFHKFLK